MNKVVALTFLVACFGSVLSAFSQARGKSVLVIADEAHQKVDITIDGKPFTSYIWPSTLKKPVLFPLLSDRGIAVTRGFPLKPHPDERVDHPHQVGLWFDYGDVNGFDFWNNSDAIKPEDRSKMGTIVHDGIQSTQSGTNRGELIVNSTWVTGENKGILKQTTRYVFVREQRGREIDLVITLQALDRAVFSDDKEGLLGIRVARWLESPEEKGGVFMDAQGKPTTVDAAPPGSRNANLATGVYLTSEGARGSSTWGTRGRWCALTGHTGKHSITIAMFDHPGNPDYPTYWHARGYGLFAANPLGRSVFAPKEQPLNLTLEPGQSATFRYRVVIYSGTTLATEIDREADAFAAE
jgi:hypothetical protein